MAQLPESDLKHSPFVAIFGGSFNPIHLGHMRLVLEVLEATEPKRFDLLPCARPPHKGCRDILPFELRVEMLRAATQGLDKVRINVMENERDGPSYTADTLQLYADREPQFRHCFIIGAEDFPLIRTWFQWERIPQLADILVVPRAGFGHKEFDDTVHDLWPESVPMTPPCPAMDAAYALPGVANAGWLLHLPLPRLDIRSELIRERLLADRSVRFLVPDAVNAILLDHPEIKDTWKT